MDRGDLTGLFSRLFQAALDVVLAEFRLARAKALARLRVARTGLILLAAALIFALAALVGLVVGLVLALTPHVGGVAAGAILCGAGLAIAAGLGWAGATRLSSETPAKKAVDRVDAVAEQTW